MVVVGNPAEHNEKEVKTRYPVDDGLEAGTNTQIGHVMNLIPQIGSKVPKRFKVGIG